MWVLRFVLCFFDQLVVGSERVFAPPKMRNKQVKRKRENGDDDHYFAERC